jgi:hypothetical protein
LPGKDKFSCDYSFIHLTQTGEDPADNTIHGEGTDKCLALVANSRQAGGIEIIGIPGRTAIMFGLQPGACHDTADQREAEACPRIPDDVAVVFEAQQRVKAVIEPHEFVKQVPVKLIPRASTV